MNRFFILFFISIFLLKPCFGQAREQLSREQMIEDINTLFYTIYQVHPDMYAVYPREQFEKHLERLKSELAPYGDRFYFYKQVQPLVVKLGDGHTGLFPPFRGPEDFDGILFFPFSVRLNYPDKTIRVRQDFTQSQNTIPFDAQITSINNRQASEIVSEMMRHISGERDFFRISQAENNFIPLLYVLYGESVFDIEYVFNDEKKSAQVTGLPFEEVMENPSKEEALQNLYTFRTLPDKNIGIIEFNVSWDLNRFSAFLDSTFRVLQEENIGNLIIDIRTNPGGIQCLNDELFQYISPVPFRQTGKVIARHSDILRELFIMHGETPPSHPNGIQVIENTNLTQLRENPLRYTGNVFLLTSHRTFSASAMLSWVFKYLNMGTVIGEETGGLAFGFGASPRMFLPNSGLMYNVSTRQFFLFGATAENNHGTLPDYEIDAEKALDFAIDLIMRGE